VVSGVAAGQPLLKGKSKRFYPTSGTGKVRPKLGRLVTETFSDTSISNELGLPIPEERFVFKDWALRPFLKQPACKRVICTIQ
jgi:hypothetical protein